MNEIHKEYEWLNDISKEEVAKRAEENYKKWQQDIEKVVDDPTLDFKGNFIKKHLSKIYGEDIITMSGKTIIFDKGDAMIEDPYTELKCWEGIDEKKSKYIRASFKKALESYSKVIEQFPSVAKGVT